MPRYKRPQKNNYSGQWLGQYPDNAKGDAEDSNFDAKQFFNNKEYWKAIGCLTEAILLNPNSSTFYNNRSICFENVHLLDNALMDAKKSLEIDQTTKHLERFVLLALECNAIDSAIGFLEKARIQLNTKQFSLEPGLNSLKKLKLLETKIQKTNEHKNYQRKLYYLEQGLNETPECVRYILEKAETLVFLGKCEEAERMLYKAEEMNGETGSSMYVRGLLILYRDDDLDKALHNFESIIFGELPNNELYKKAKFKHDSILALKQKKEKGNEAFLNYRYAEAYDIYSEALTVDHLNNKLNAQLHFNRAQALNRLKKKQEAIKELDSAINLQPNYIKAVLKRAEFYLNLDNFDDSIVNYEAAIAMGLNGVSDKLIEESEKFYHTALLKRAQICLKLNNYEQVIKDYDKVCNLDIGEDNRIQFEATYLKAMKKRADGYFDKGKLKTAINVYEQFFEIQVKEANEELLQSCKNAYISAILKRAKQSTINGDLKQAITDYETIFNMETDRKSELKQDYEEDYLKVLMQRAQEYLDNKLYRLAINEYERILVMDFSQYFIKSCNCETSYLMASLQLAQHYFDNGNFEKSVKTYESTFENDVSLKHKQFLEKYEDCYIEALKMRAESFLDLGIFEEAAKVYNKICKINGNETYKETFEMLVQAMNITKQISHYKVLKVAKTASQEEIKKAYYKLSKIHHPDRHIFASAGRKKAQNDIFKIIQNAYDTLSDPETRAQYDRKNT